MHVLDNHISTLEQTIEKVHAAYTSVESPDLQVGLARYCWITLDSWVCWRTLRFLLRRNDIERTVAKKWFSTPASYTASQLTAAWSLDATKIDNQCEDVVGLKFRNLIGNNIQKNRNDSAHMNPDPNQVISGSSIENAFRYFKFLRDIFQKRELQAFAEDFENKMRALSDSFCLSEVRLDKNPPTLKFQYKERVFYLKLDTQGAYLTEEPQLKKPPLLNPKNKPYRFTKEKSYYGTKDDLIDSIIKTMKKDYGVR